MSKTNDTPATLDDHRPLTDNELDAVTGGLVVPSIIGILVGPGPSPSLKEPAPEKHWFNGG
jgi:bacteriocin-like protein